MKNTPHIIGFHNFLLFPKKKKNDTRNVDVCFNERAKGMDARFNFSSDKTLFRSSIVRDKVYFEDKYSVADHPRKKTFNVLSDFTRT